MASTERASRQRTAAPGNCSRLTPAGIRERRRAAVQPRLGSGPPIACIRPLGSAPTHTTHRRPARCFARSVRSEPVELSERVAGPGDMAAREPRAEGTGRVGGGWSADQRCARGRGPAQAEHREQQTEHERPLAPRHPHAVPKFPDARPCATAASRRALGPLCRCETELGGSCCGQPNHAPVPAARGPTAELVSHAPGHLPALERRHVAAGRQLCGIAFHVKRRGCSSTAAMAGARSTTPS